MESLRGRPSRVTPQPESILAEELHRQYRAADKALEGSNKHDHGWTACRNKRYFTRRARLIIQRAAIRNPDTLGEAEVALQSTVLLRRSSVCGDPA